MPQSKPRPLLIGLAVLAIVAVLATVAIPAWRNHRIASHLDQALQAGDGAKLVVMEAATTRGGLNQLKPGDLTFDAQSSLNDYAAKVDISESGRITITTRDTGATPDPVFLLTPLEGPPASGGTLTWSCDVLTGNPQWIPSHCLRPNVAVNTSAPANAATTH